MVQKICKGETLKGKSCKNKCKKGCKYCYCHSKKGGKTPKRKIPVRLGRFSRYPPKKICVNYQNVCKKSPIHSFGNVYENKCSYRNSLLYNQGLKKQAEKCVKLRKENRKCRMQSGLKATPKHDYAIKRIQWNADDCGNIIYNQTRPVSAKFRKSPPKSTRSIRPQVRNKTPLRCSKSTSTFLTRAVKK